MADEEQGFTFVDKRRTGQESAPADTPTPAAEAPPPASESAVMTNDAAEDGSEYEGDDGEGPDIYGVLGYCVSLLSAEAWQKLGLLADPKSGEAKADLVQAKVAIDAVGDLAARLEAGPRESVPDSLRRDLRTLLNDLRLNYISRQNNPVT